MTVYYLLLVDYCEVINHAECHTRAANPTGKWLSGSPHESAAGDGYKIDTDDRVCQSAIVKARAPRNKVSIREGNCLGLW
jgi:hypothetical protein